MVRLPQSGQDEGEWGNLLNAFLLVEHNNDGTLKSVARPDNVVTSVAGKTGAVGLTKSDVGLTAVTDDTQVKASDVDTDDTMAADSDTKVPSQKAVKTYVDQRVAAASDHTDIMALAIAL